MKIHWLGMVLAGTVAWNARAGGIQILNADAHFAEGPVWYQGKLYYVEYGRNSVTTWDGTKNPIFWSQKGCGPSAVIPTARGEFLTTCYDSKMGVPTGMIFMRNEHGSHNPDEALALEDFEVATRALLRLLLDFPL